MFEISRNDYDALDYYVNERIAYPNAEYDFTFENRFLIYHAPIRYEWVYFVLDMKTNLSSEAHHCKKPMRMTNPREFVPFVLDAIRYTGDRRYINSMSQKPIELIDSLFRNVLTDYGFTVREEQIELSKQIYRGLTSYTASLCEAEVGTGKTLAYLIASVVARKQYGLTVPITVTTSNIELQKTLIEKEIPRLSKILIDYRLIDEPLKAVFRKGKEHFFCRLRFEDYINKITKYPSKYEKILTFFDQTDFARRTFDLDTVKIPSFLKNKLCVKGCREGCEYADECKYYRYTRSANNSPEIDFQVTNHNLFLTSERLRKENEAIILKPSDYVIIDEAHKLKSSAEDVFGETLSESDINKYIRMVKYHCNYPNMREEYVKSLNAVTDFSSALFNIVRNNVNTEDMESDRGSFIRITPDMQAIIKKIKLNVINIESLRRKDSKKEIDGGAIIRSLKMFERPGSVITWATIDDKAMGALFCCPKQIGNVLNDTLWNSSGHYVLMSGTMSDGKNFDYFKKENGLAHVRKDKLQSSSTSSPFDYASNARLYIPEDMPFPDSNISDEYIEKITDRIVELVRATNGHTAILFTSYKALNAVYERAKDRLAKYRLIRMTRSNKTAITEFKECDNAVLFASGSMWAGIDICGDRLSSVIIVRLPFPLRSATMEEKKSASANVSAFIDDYAVPEMLIKLRQGVGRLIRTETDTGLITILDPRAKKGSYAERIRKVLRQYPEVDTIEEIEEFFKMVKSEDYFVSE